MLIEFDKESHNLNQTLLLFQTSIGFKFTINCLQQIYSLDSLYPIYNFELSTFNIFYIIMLSTFLFVFDFDHTIADCNTDTIIYNLLPENSLPEHINSQYKNDWNSFMQIVFDYLNLQNITKSQILQIMENAPITEGFLKIFQFLKENKASTIIASDSNTQFITKILQNKKIQDVFSGVFTNPAKFDGEHLRISPYELGHGCQKCRANMCKSKIIVDFIKNKQEKGVKFQKVIFVGDGGNDLCPIELNIANTAFVRKGYPLQKLVSKLQKPKCEIFFWNNGNDILSIIQKW